MQIKILHIVPEFEEGGVERYVLNLTEQQILDGHKITLATSGGKLENQIDKNVSIIHLPVHKKNLFTGIFCAVYLSMKYKNYKWDIIHAHSRVPAWISWITSKIIKIPWIMTAHAPYSLNFGIKPLIHADGVICVSDSVEKHLKNYLPKFKITIPNGIRKSKFLWHGKNLNNNTKFLFVGYLSKRKGLDVALKALNFFKDKNWTLDIVGDGSQRKNLENLVHELNLNEKVFFHGFRDDSEKFMSESDCLLFPSYQEGLPLTINEALAVGIPIIASDIEPLQKISSGNLVEPGNVLEWKNAIENFFNNNESSKFSKENLTPFNDTVKETEKFYNLILNNLKNENTSLH